MTDFKLFQLFGVPLKASRVDPVAQVKWISPRFGCVKINIDGSSVGNPPSGTIGIVSMTYQSTFIGAIAQNIGYATALEVEFSAFMYGIEKAIDMHLTDIWIGRDSLTVVKASRRQMGCHGDCFRRKTIRSLNDSTFYSSTVLTFE